MENKYFLNKNLPSSFLTALLSNPEIANFFEKIFLSTTSEEAINYLLMGLRKLLKTDDVYIYDREFKNALLYNCKLKTFLNSHLLFQIMGRLEKEHYLNYYNEVNKSCIPSKIKSIVFILLKFKTKPLGMLLIINSPLNKEKILKVCELASYFYHLILQKQKTLKSKLSYDSIVNLNSKHSKLPIYFGEFIIDSHIEFIRGDDRLISLFCINKKNNSIYSFLDYSEIRKVIKLKAQLYRQEDVKITLKFKDGNKISWFDIYGTYTHHLSNKPIYLATFIDITGQKSLERKMEITKESFHFAMKNSYSIFFQYDIDQDIFYSFSNLGKKEEKEIIYNYIANYKSKYLNLNNEQIKWIKLLSGIEMKPFPVKMNINGTKWVNVESKIIKYNKKPKIVIGKLIDITEKREAEAILIKNGSLDRVTKVYNRSSGEYLVKQYLDTKKNSKIDSLLIIDLDNFSKLNLNFGYYYGNEVLYAFAQYLQKKLSKNHIIYRHSSDHFVVFLKGIDSVRAYDLAASICEDCKNGMIVDGSVNISCSIGVACTNLSLELLELIKCADCALVNVKNGGKGFAANYFYIEKSVKNAIYEKHLGKNREKLEVNENILAFTCEILRKAENLNQGINILFKQIAKKLDLRKIIILDINKENYEAIITHHYGINLPLSNFFVEENDFSLFKSGFNHDDIYQEKPYIISGHLSRLISFSTLIISLYEHQNHFGVIFFSQENYKKESILHLISNIISIYIISEFNKNEVEHRAELIMKLSHEIRTPLNGIKGMVRIARGEINNKEKLVSALDKISMSSKYLLSLVNNILDLSRIQKGKMKICGEPFNLSTFIDDVSTLMRIQAEDKNIHFKVINKSHDDLILGDVFRLNQVLINIIGNAIKFTPENGHIIFKITETANNESNKIIKFSVKDDGIGINPQNLQRIFNAFEQENTQTGKFYGGTGLGLAISSALIEMMGGKIEVKSEINRGSEFYFSLPFQKAQNLYSESWRLKFIDKRILVAEDNSLNLKIITSFLQEFGCQYDTANNGREAVERFVQNEPYYYDLVLMDVRMPIIDGFEATQMIRSSGKDDALLIPIIAMTANAFPEEEQATLECGMNAHIIKPIDIKLLYKEFTSFLK